MPGQAPAATDERELLAGYVGQQQDGFGNAIHGLTDDEVVRAAVASTTLTVGTLMKHATQAQQDWLDQVRAAAGVEVPAADAAAVGAAWQAAWTWSEDDNVATVTEAFDAVSAPCSTAYDASTSTSRCPCLPMYELMAGREGWPETDWLKPWRRSS